MFNKKMTGREKSKMRIQKKLRGTEQCPRFTVFKSNQYVYAQLIDDDKGHTLVSYSTQGKEFKKLSTKTDGIEAGKIVGEAIAKRALEKNIKAVRFDRNGYLFHGVVKAIAEKARETGLKF